MAHFFASQGAHAAEMPLAADQDAISELIAEPNGNASFGIWGAVWGKGGKDESFTVKVARGGTFVSEGAHSAVKLHKAGTFLASHAQTYTASGLKTGDTIQAWDGDGKPQTAALPVTVRSATDLIETWAAHFAGVGQNTPNDRVCCRWAVPYLALKDHDKKGQELKTKMPKLASKCIGPTIASVHGLAVHCTTGNPSRTPFHMVSWGLVPTWNGNGASAHFAIAGDGTIVQLIPTNRVANAQHSPGNFHWISVEIENNGKSKMNDQQLLAAKLLAAWVWWENGISPTVATGCLYKTNTAFDKLTTEVCDKAHASTTHDNYQAVMSKGISCHWWLDPVKTGKHVHSCPGPGILSQLPEIAWC
jgi:hypothetical protein